LRLRLAKGAALSFVLAASPAWAADLRVISSGGYTAVYRKLVPQADSATGNVTHLEFGASMGASPTAIPTRVRRGDDIDLVVMVGYALDDLIKEGLVIPESRVDLARSPIAMAVKAGAPKPDIGTVEAFKNALLAAKSIGYSDSASGVYLAKELFPKLGIADQLRGKTHMITAPKMVGEAVAIGEEEIGFQQLSELNAVPGVDIVGLIPAQVQLITIFSAGVVKASKHPAEAMAVERFLRSSAAAQVVREAGLDPIP